MSDDRPENPGERASRPFSTLPDRPPIREVHRSAGFVPTAIENRSAARSDALSAVAKARMRRGALHADWSGQEADIVHAITELLLQVQTEPGAEQHPMKGA
jgi:hypothetical protein